MKKKTIIMVKLSFHGLQPVHLGCISIGPRQANLVLIAYASSEGSGEPAHPHSLARTFAARSYKQWLKRNLQTESQIPGPSEWLGMRSWNLSWRNARRHKFSLDGVNSQIQQLSVKKRKKKKKTFLLRWPWLHCDVFHQINDGDRRSSWRWWDLVRDTGNEKSIVMRR